MSQDNEILPLLKQIEANQRAALETQQQHLELAKAQLDRSNQTIQESIDLQRTAVARQAQLTKILLPIVGLMLVLLVFLLFRWGIL